MKSPGGVILAAVVLGLGAAVQLATALVFAVATAAAGRPHTDGTVANPAVLAVAEIAFALLFVLLAGWAIATLVGLLRLKSWARYSVLGIGGCLAAVAALMLLVTVATAAIPQNSATPLPASAIAAAVAVEAGLTLVAGAIGIWWLVYFSLRRTAQYFVPSAVGGYGAPYAVSPPRPLYSAAPPPLPYPARFPPGKPGMFSRGPWPIAVMGCLFLFGGASCLIGTFIPFPIPFGGFLLTGVSGHLFCAVCAVAYAAVGWGLLRLQNWARLTCFGLLAVNLVNLALLPTARSQAAMTQYMQILFDGMGSFYARIGVPASAIPPPMQYDLSMMIPSLIFGLVMSVAMMWALVHYRSAFLRRGEDQAAG